MSRSIRRGEASPPRFKAFVFSATPLCGETPQRPRESKGKNCCAILLKGINPRKQGWCFVLNRICERALCRAKGATAHKSQNKPPPLPFFRGFYCRANSVVFSQPSCPSFLVSGGYYKSRGLYYVQHKPEAVLYAAIFAYGFLIGSPPRLGSRSFHAQNS